MPDFRIFNINLKQYVKGAWDEQIPLINHQILEIIIDNKVFNNEEISAKLKTFCNEMSFSIVNILEHGFSPHGNSTVVVLEESHIAIHYWPEKMYMHFDIVTCTKKEISLNKMMEVLKKLFSAENMRIINLNY